MADLHPQNGFDGARADDEQMAAIGPETVSARNKRSAAAMLFMPGDRVLPRGPRPAQSQFFSRFHCLNR